MRGTPLQKKLRLRSPKGLVVVIQDGSAPDAEADAPGNIRVDDGFRVGHPNPRSASFNQRITISIDRLEATRDQGKTLSFAVHDWTEHNHFELAPGTQVEFSCEGPAVYAAPGGFFPAWHAWEQAPGAAHMFFRGVVSDVPRTTNPAGLGSFRVECVDALSWANDVTLQQSIADGVDIPELTFNVEQRDSGGDDWMTSVKAYTRLGGNSALERFRIGNPSANEDPLMTLSEILEYLEAAYRSPLEDRGILPSGAPLFDPVEREELAGIVPPRTTLKGGFGSAVRSLIRANVPELEIIVDPRTGTWHLVSTRDALVGEGETITADLGGGQYTVSDGSRFAVTGNGSTARVVSVSESYKTEVVAISAVDGDNVTFEAPLFTFEAGDIIVPMYGVLDRVPIVQLRDAEIREEELAVDLSQSYGAVKVTARRQKTERIELSTKASPDVAAKIASAWDAAYDATYRGPAHSERRTDKGADLNGIVIHEIDNTHTGSTWIYFSQLTSSFGADHAVTNGNLGQSEWTGAALHLLTQAAGNISENNVSAIVTFFSPSGWIDSPADTERRFLVKLDRDIVALAPGLLSVLADGNGDRFELSTSQVYKPTNPNGRWLANRYYQIENTTEVDEGRLLGDSNCIGTANYQGNFGQTLYSPALPALRSTPDIYSHQGQVNYHGFNPKDPFGGVVRAFLIQPPEPPPGFAELCAALPPQPPPPREIKREYDKWTLDVLSARVPAAGFAGNAHHFYGETKELVLLSDGLVREDQVENYEAVAERIWRRVSEPRYTGTLTLAGAADWLGFTDLAMRVRLEPGREGFAAGQPTERRRFWGLISSVSIDFASGQTQVAFGASGESDYDIEVLERLFVDAETELAEVKARQLSLEEQFRCSQVNPPQPQPTVVSGCHVDYGGQDVAGKVAPIDLKDDALGGGETALGISPPGDASNGPDNRGSRGFMRAYLGERDHEGKVAAVLVGSGAYYGGLEVGARFEVDPTAPADMKHQPQVNSERIDELGKALFGVSIDAPAQNQTVRLAAGSTDLTLQLEIHIPNDGRFAGGYAEFYGVSAGLEARPRYKIGSHTASSITLAARMDESVPPEGAAVRLWAPRLPRLDPSVFTTRGTAVYRDRVGELFAVKNDVHVNVEEKPSGFLAAKDAQVVPEVAAGSSAARTLARGPWHFELPPTGHRTGAGRERLGLIRGWRPNFGSSGGSGL